jgi:hemoglobin-like flavoprotein
MDKVGRQLFQGVSMVRQAQALMKMMSFVMGAIDNPTRLVIPLKKSGCRHLIYGVERKNFQSFGIALAKTFEQVLGPEHATPAVKESWFVLIQTLGEIMMQDYEDIRNGYTGRIYKKDGSKWRMYPTLLTHEKLVLYKDDARERVKEEIDLHLLDGMELETDDLPGRTQKVTPHCFSLTTSGTIKSYFCTDTEDELLQWTEVCFFASLSSVPAERFFGRF